MRTRHLFGYSRGYIVWEKRLFEIEHKALSNNSSSYATLSASSEHYWRKCRGRGLRWREKFTWHDENERCPSWISVLFPTGTHGCILVLCCISAKSENMVKPLDQDEKDLMNSFEREE